ncbi:hypothetical protein GCM10009789_36810 [Kribbella sancticallisti]|uniref:Polyketide cyclase / dehydrase and lipid transport n=1 Tax=Kribbella sancticallisti TaxID=460087 RepID=A0ABP4PI34_9ACTN
MRVEESIIINRSSAEVFAFFDNRTNDTKWMRTVLESEWLDPGTTTQLGRRGRFVMNAMGRRKFTDEVTEYEPGRIVAHQFVSEPMVFHSGCIAERAGDGCRTTVWFEPDRLPGGIFGRLAAPLTLRIVRRNFKADLARLKTILEAEQRETSADEQVGP